MPFERWPKFLQDRPTLLIGLDLYFDAFTDLSTCRQIGMSVGPIPYTAIIEYSRVHGFDYETSQLLLRYISEMDSAYLRYQYKKVDSETKKKPRRSRNG